MAFKTIIIDYKIRKRRAHVVNKWFSLYILFDYLGIPLAIKIITEGV